MNNYTGLGAFAQGVAKGLDQYKQDSKEAEQQTYDRNRQAVADQQATGLYEDQRKNNEQTFKYNGLKFQSAQQEYDEATKKKEGQQHFAKLYGMRQNGDITGMLGDINSRIQPSMSLSGTQQMKYDQNADGTISLNVYDTKDPSKPLRTHVAGLSDEDVFGRARFLYDPDGALESHLTSQAEAAKSANKISEEVAIMAGKQPYEMAKIGAQASNAQDLAVLNSGLTYQRDRANYNDKGEIEAYKIKNKPSETTKQRAERQVNALNASAASQSAARASKAAADLISHVGLVSGTGWTSASGIIPSSDAKAFQTQLENLKSQLFLPAIQQMKGMGALSNAEGQKVEAAIQNLDVKVSPDEMKTRLATVAEHMKNLAQLSAQEARIYANQGKNGSQGATNSGQANAAKPALSNILFD